MPKPGPPLERPLSGHSPRLDDEDDDGHDDEHGKKGKRGGRMEERLLDARTLIIADEVSDALYRRIAMMLTVLERKDRKAPITAARRTRASPSSICSASPHAPSPRWPTAWSPPRPCSSTWARRRVGA